MKIIKGVMSIDSEGNLTITGGLHREIVKGVTMDSNENIVITGILDTKSSVLYTNNMIKCKVSGKSATGEEVSISRAMEMELKNMKEDNKNKERDIIKLSEENQEFYKLIVKYSNEIEELKQVNKTLLEHNIELVKLSNKLMK